MTGQRLLRYDELEVAGDATLEADLRGMFRRAPGDCWFLPLTLETAALHASAIAPEAYLLGECGAEHYREAEEADGGVPGRAPPAACDRLPARAGRETPEVLDGYHRVGAMIQEQMRDVVSSLEGVGEVVTDLTWTPPWSPEMMSDDAKFVLGF